MLVKQEPATCVLELPDSGSLSMLLISNSHMTVSILVMVYILSKQFYKLIMSSLFLKANPNYSSATADGATSTGDPEVLNEK